MDGDAEPLEAREARPWCPGDGPMRTRSWGPRGPVVQVYVEGVWRRARVRQRQDRADGTVTIHVAITLPSAGDQSASARAYLWEPRSIRAVQDAGEEPVETRWDAEEAAAVTSVAGARR